MSSELTFRDMIMKHASTVIISDEDQYLEPENLFEGTILVLAEMLIKTDTKFITENMEDIISKMLEKDQTDIGQEKFNEGSTPYASMLSLMGEQYLITRTIFTFYLAIILRMKLSETLDYTDLVPKILAETFINTDVDEKQFKESYKYGLDVMKKIVNNYEEGNDLLHQEILGNVSISMNLYLEKQKFDEAVEIFSKAIGLIYSKVETGEL